MADQTTVKIVLEDEAKASPAFETGPRPEPAPPPPRVEPESGYDAKHAAVRAKMAGWAAEEEARRAAARGEEAMGPPAPPGWKPPWMEHWAAAPERTPFVGPPSVLARTPEDLAGAPPPQATGPTGPAVPAFDMRAPQAPAPTPREVMYGAGAAPPPVQAAGAAEGAAGAAAGAAGGAAMAALGPAGAVIAGVKMAGEAIQSVGKVATAAADGIKSFASGDNLGGLVKATNAAAEGLGKIPIVGGALEAGLKGATAVVTAFSEVTDAFVERGKFLSQYSPELAGAGARAEITSMMGDIKEAEELGPGIARLTDAQSDISDSFREILLPIKGFLLDVLAPIMEAFAGFMSFVKDILTTVFKVVGTLASVLSPVKIILDAINDNSGKLVEMEEEKARKVALDKAAKALELFDQQMRERREAAKSAPKLGKDPVGAAAPPPRPLSPAGAL